MQKKPQQKIKGIVGCVFNICENYKDRTHKDNGYQMVLLAKNKKLPKPIADKKMVAEINKIGKNFNQITKKINAGFKINKRFTEELQEIKKQLEAILTKIG